MLEAHADDAPVRNSDDTLARVIKCQADGHESWMVGGVGQKVSGDKSAIVRWRDKPKQKTHRAA
jgi:hypothetical protein